MTTHDLLLVEVLLTWDHLLDLILLLIELSQHLLALILQYKITSIYRNQIKKAIITFFRARASWCIHLLHAGVATLRSRAGRQGNHWSRCYGKTLINFLTN